MRLGSKNVSCVALNGAKWSVECLSRFTQRGDPKKFNGLETGYAVERIQGPVVKSVCDPSENPAPILRSSYIYSRSDTDSAYPLYVDWTCKMWDTRHTYHRKYLGLHYTRRSNWTPWNVNARCPSFSYFVFVRYKHSPQPRVLKRLRVSDQVSHQY
jgi:hypothetical protein